MVNAAYGVGQSASGQVDGCVPDAPWVTFTTGGATDSTTDNIFNADGTILWSIQIYSTFGTGGEIEFDYLNFLFDGVITGGTSYIESDAFTMPPWGLHESVSLTFTGTWNNGVAGTGTLDAHDYRVPDALLTVPSPVPEPMSLMLLASGLVPILLRRRH
jgi:hypothetical protein